MPVRAPSEQVSRLSVGKNVVKPRVPQRFSGPHRGAVAGVFASGCQSLGALVMGLAVLMGATAHADKIVLKDGRMIEGVIDMDRSDEKRVFLRTSAGTLRFPRANVASIERRENIGEDERRAEIAFQRGDLDESLHRFLRALKSNPEDEYLSGRVLDLKQRIDERDTRQFEADFKLIDFQVSLQHFDEALELAAGLVPKAQNDSARDRCSRKLADVYSLQARNFKNKVDYAKAEEAYESSIEAYPDFALAHLELADMIAIYPPRLEEAYDLYKKGISLVEADPTLLDRGRLLEYQKTIGDVQFRMSEFRSAANTYWVVSQRDTGKRFPRVSERIIQSYRPIMDELIEDTPANDRAISNLRQIIADRPNESRGHILLGRIYYKREDWENAMPLLEKALANMQGFAPAGDEHEVRFQLAISYRHTEQDLKALDLLLTVLKAQESRYEAICELGEIYLDLLEHRKALAQFDKGKRVDPGQYRAWLGAGRTLKEMEQYEEALEQYEQLFDLTDENPQYLFEMGLIYSAMGDRIEDAHRTYLRVIDLMGDEDEVAPMVRNRLAEVYTNLGLTEVGLQQDYQALEYFDRALSYAPDYAAAINGKGQCYVTLKKLDRAEGLFKDAIGKAPNNPSYVLSLGVLYHKHMKDPSRALPLYLRYFDLGGADPNVAEWIRECGGKPPA